MIWGKWRAADVMDHDEKFTVKFIPTGGFNKNGAFREGSGEAEYERPEFLTLVVRCKKLKFTRSWGLECHNVEGQVELKEVASMALGGTGEVQLSRCGRYSLSFLGSDRTHTRLHVSIREGTERFAMIVPVKAQNDLDASWDESFSVDTTLDRESFRELRQELRGNPSFSVEIEIKLDEMRGLYTTWSPSISEGRVLKFLDRMEDIENAEEIPVGFDSVTLREKLAFRVRVGDFGGEDSVGEEI